MSKIFKKVTSFLENVSGHIDDSATSFLEGAMESAKSSVKLFDGLIFGGSGKTFDLLQLISLRHGIVKSLYPSIEVEKRLRDDPENEMLLIEFYEIKERQFKFSLKLLRLLNLTPFSMEMSSKSASLIEHERNEEKNRQVRLSEIKLILERLSVKVDEALSQNVKTEDFENLIENLIKAKLLIKDYEHLESWLAISKEVMVEAKTSHLAGQFFLSVGQYESAYAQLMEAYGQNIKYSEDDLAECLDELIASTEGQDKDHWKQMRTKAFPNIVGKENMAKLTNLPMCFLTVKLQEIQKILNWGKNEKAS